MIATAAPPSSTAENPSADRYLDVPGARLRYRDEGRGPAVMLLHGWTLDLEMWDPQVAGLRSDLRLVRFDRRGSGHDATDMAALCRHLNIARIALIGMSQGARASLQFAAKAPEIVSALILDGPPALDGAAAEDDVPIAHLREVLESRGVEAFRREWRSHPLVQLRSRDPAIRQLVDRMIERYAAQDLDARDAIPPLSLDSMPAPTLILSGEFDLSSRLRTAARLRAQLRAAEHVVVPDAGHLINLDQPKIYNELCRSFLARHAIISTD
ncbi:MAG TPA: alpha/beta hydrolase [Steroidobacteraceae bacterium]|jgi:pimeloyl-[acyl-carrier protein] methyl ester esterase